MRIIAIDPGYERVGIAILDKLQDISLPAQAGGKLQEELLYSNCFKTSSKLPLSQRILMIGKEIEKLIKKYKPNMLAIEKLYFTTNQKTAMGVSEARGVIIYECSQVGLKILEYTPLQVKIAVTGYGRASKEAVSVMTKKLINVEDRVKSDDEIDAIAIGLTCFAHVINSTILGPRP